jgi:hypothetical protein
VTRSEKPSEADGAVHAEGAKLILTAFRIARDSGRRDWNRMTDAVLKNRILGATGRAFDESSFGARTFREFLQRYGELITIDTTTRPPTVALKDPNAFLATQTASVEDSRTRVRRDLWMAVLDFSSGLVYVLDDEIAVGIPSETYDNAAHGPRMPTIDADTLGAWRTAFVGEHTDRRTPDDVRDRLGGWSEDGTRGDWMVPQPLRRAWNAELKLRVVETLTTWFSENGLPMPDNALETRSAGGDTGYVEQLRALAVRVVRAMTQAELEELRLPAAALLRAEE